MPPKDPRGSRHAGRNLSPLLVFIKCGDLDCAEFRVSSGIRGIRGNESVCTFIHPSPHTPGASWRSVAVVCGCPCSRPGAERPGCPPAYASQGAGCRVQVPPQVHCCVHMSCSVMGWDREGPIPAIPGRVGERGPFIVFQSCFLYARPCPGPWGWAQSLACMLAEYSEHLAAL